MPTSDATHKPPKDLKTPGRFLWLAVVNDLPAELEFDQRDFSVLTSACALYDRICELERAVSADGVTLLDRFGATRLHPALPEIRQSRVAVARLLDQIEMSSPATGSQMPASRAAKKSAAERWREHDGRNRRSTAS